MNNLNPKLSFYVGGTDARFREGRIIVLDQPIVNRFISPQKTEVNQRDRLPSRSVASLRDFLAHRRQLT